MTIKVLIIHIFSPLRQLMFVSVHTRIITSQPLSLAFSTFDCVRASEYGMHSLSAAAAAAAAE